MEINWDGFYLDKEKAAFLDNSIDLSNTTHDMKITIMENNHIVGAALIRMEYKLVDGCWSSFIHTEKSIEYPKENGEYQNITQEMVEEYFEAK